MQIQQPAGTKPHWITLQVVLPQLWVSDVGDVVERPRQNGLVLELVLELAVSGRLLHCLPGGLCKLWRLGNASRQLGSQPERHKNTFNPVKLH